MYGDLHVQCSWSSEEEVSNSTDRVSVRTRPKGVLDVDGIGILSGGDGRYVDIIKISKNTLKKVKWHAVEPVTPLHGG